MSFALIGIVCLWSVMPGPATMLILGDAWNNGRRAGIVTTLAGCVGVGLYLALALLFGTTASGEGSWVIALQILGASYLAGLGMLSIRQGFKMNAAAADGFFVAAKSEQGSSVGSALVLACLSPQVAILYLVLLPQTEFTGVNWQFGVLTIGLVHMLFRLCWYSGLILLTEPLQALVNGAFVQRGMKHAAGTLFLLLSAGMIW